MAVSLSMSHSAIGGYADIRCARLRGYSTNVEVSALNLSTSSRLAITRRGRGVRVGAADVRVGCPSHTSSGPFTLWCLLGCDSRLPQLVHAGHLASQTRRRAFMQTWSISRGYSVECLSDVLNGRSLAHLPVPRLDLPLLCRACACTISNSDDCIACGSGTIAGTCGCQYEVMIEYVHV